MVDELAATIARKSPGQRGFTRANFFRMKQLYDAYQSDKKVAPLVRQLPWTHHLILLGRTKHREESFYLLAAIHGRWSKRELQRQIRTGAALRGAGTTKKVSPMVRQIRPETADEFKSAYSLELLCLPQDHSEADLHGALLRDLGRFIHPAKQTSRNDSGFIARLSLYPSETTALL